MSSLILTCKLNQQPADAHPLRFSIAISRRSGQSQFLGPELATGQAHPSPWPAYQPDTGPFPTLGVRPVQPLSMPLQLPLSCSPNPELQQPVTPHLNPLRNVRMGEQHRQSNPPQPAPSLPPPLQLPPPPPPRQVDDQCQSRQQLPAAFRPTVLPSQANLTQPQQQPHDDVLDPTSVGTIPDPIDTKTPMGNLRAAMGLDKTPKHNAYYSVIRVRALPHFPHTLTHPCSRTLFVVRWWRSGGPIGPKYQKKGRNGFM